MEFRQHKRDYYIHKLKYSQVEFFGGFIIGLRMGIFLNVDILDNVSYLFLILQSVRFDSLRLIYSCGNLIFHLGQKFNFLSLLPLPPLNWESLIQLMFSLGY